MAKYDDVSWHFEGDYPKDLPKENAATHIGMYLHWCIDNELMSDEQLMDCEEDIKQVKARNMSGVDYLMVNCDGKFSSYDLNELGIEFTNTYYQDDVDFAEKFGAFVDDYEEVFQKAAKESGNELKSFYQVENTVENYNLLKTIIDERFAYWKKNKNKPDLPVDKS